MKIYDYNKSLGQKVVTCSRFIANGLNKKFKELNCPLTFEQWRLMNCLNHQEGISQNHLADIVDRDYTTVSRLLSTLIKSNMIRRVADANDKRTNLVFLTEEGRGVLDHLANVHVQVFLDEMVRDIPDQDIEVFSSVLDRIILKLES
ncbi:MarR family winged helix-turn-helix transcriptional regulator [Paenibacillus sp. EC2-1]|uniref:MarR family winged helix-turn-helix transcriptional regulator n=1 Tax=Paenibacillus sp. EC2-1 TaxID=3388665 RepID=UPI003BEF2433